MKFISYHYDFVDAETVHPCPTLYTFNVFARILGFIDLPIKSFDGTDFEKCKNLCKEYINERLSKKKDR